MIDSKRIIAEQVRVRDNFFKKRIFTNLCSLLGNFDGIYLALEDFSDFGDRPLLGVLLVISGVAVDALIVSLG